MPSTKRERMAEGSGMSGREGDVFMVSAFRSPHGEEARLRRLEPCVQGIAHPSRRPQERAPQDEGCVRSVPRMLRSALGIALARHRRCAACPGATYGRSSRGSLLCGATAKLVKRRGEQGVVNREEGKSPSFLLAIRHSLLASSHSRSTMVTLAMPPPSHMVCRP